MVVLLPALLCAAAFLQAPNSDYGPTLPAYAGPNELPPAKITVDARQLLAKNDPFWAAFVFHPTEYLSTEWGRQYLRTLRKTGACQTLVRLYNQPEDAAVQNPDGTISYNWAHFDERADFVLQQGVKPLVAFAFMPTQIAKDPQAGRHRPFLDGKWICYSPPKDYKLWQSMCEDFTRHVIQRYGEDEVAQWYFTCWNEPDLASFWQNGDTKEYLKLYDYFAAGVKAVCPRVRIGGPAYAGSNWRPFFEHITNGTNYATGDKGAPLDYIDIHSYGGGGGAGPVSRCPSLDSVITKHLACAKARDEFPELRDVPIIVTEWGVTSNGGTGMAQQPMAEVRNSQYSAAFLTTMVARHVGLRQTNDPRVISLMICLSGHEVAQQSDFEGKRKLVTLNGFYKPILNGYQLLARQGPELIGTSLDGPHPTVTAIGARDRDRRITVLVTNFQNTAPRNDGPSVQVSLRIETGWAAGTQARLTHWRIDETHSNAYTVFRALGRPKQPTPEQIEQIKRRMDLETLEPAQTVSVNGPVELSFELPCNGVSLIEFQA